MYYKTNIIYLLYIYFRIEHIKTNRRESNKWWWQEEEEEEKVVDLFYSYLDVHIQNMIRKWH